MRELAPWSIPTFAGLELKARPDTVLRVLASPVCGGPMHCNGACEKNDPLLV